MNALQDADSGPASFPLRIAATDVGSNAIRFFAVEFSEDAEFTVLEQLRVPVRLGHDVFRTGFLTGEAIEAAARAFGTFMQRLEHLQILRHRAVATSAVRESRNGGELIERALRESSIDLEVISGAEEARLVHVAVRDRIRMDSPWVIADLGGGSVEVSIVDENRIFRTETYAMGSVRLLEELIAAEDAPAHLQRRLDEYTAVLRDSRILANNVAGFAATGGNIETLAKLAGAKRDRKNVARLHLTDLRTTIERLASMSYDERVDTLQLREDRADVILPAAMVYQRIAELAGAKTIYVPNVGVKEGVVIDLFDRVDGEER